MIFKETWRQVLNGTKTQTRRPVKPNESGIVFPGAFQMVFLMTNWQEETLDGFDCQVRDRKRLKWQVGKTYAVQPGRGKKAVGRIRITKIRRERLQEICGVDLIAEGYPTDFSTHSMSDLKDKWSMEARMAWFRGLWSSLYRKPYRWEDNPEVWVLELGKVEER